MAMRDSLLYLSEESLYGECRKWHVRVHDSVMSVADMDKLVRNWCAVKCDHIPSTRVFSVNEDAKERRRFIQETLAPNVLCPDPVNPGFKRLDHMKRLLLRGLYAASLDWRCFYYQLPLHERVWSFFTVAVGGQSYMFTRLPMGFKWAVAIAQTITLFLSLGLVGVTIDVYIDNMLIVGDETSVRAAVAIVLARCRAYNVSVGSVEMGTTVTHRGVVLDFLNKTVMLKESFRTKLERRVAVLGGVLALSSSSPPQAKWAQWLSLFSSVTYAACVLAFPLAGLFHTYKWWARHVSCPGHALLCP